MATTPSVSEQTFNASVTTPIAQVTVVDGKEGDCNIVDFCSLPLKSGDYQDDCWRRVLIDTGMSNSGIVNTLQLLVTELPFPKMSTHQDPPDDYPLSEMQITHPDQDHIGNASDFLDAMCKTKTNASFIKDCKVVFSQIPDLYMAPEIKAEPTEYYTSQSNTPMNRRKYKASINEGWTSLMARAGFTVNVKLSPATDTIREWTLKDDEAEWDDETIDDVNRDECTVYYYQEAVDDNELEAELVAQVEVVLPEDGDVKAEVRKYTKTDKKTKIVTVTWGALVQDQHDALNSLNQVVPMTDNQKDKLRLTKTFPLKWVVPAKKYKKSVPAPKFLMSKMAIIVPKIDFNASKRGLEMQVIRSVPQVLDLGKKISTCNALSTNPRLQSIIPKRAQIVRPTKLSALKKQSGTQFTIGPSDLLYQNMMREIMLQRWALDGAGRLNPTEGNVSVDGDVTNRASVVTMFERHDKPNPPSRYFSMLFTGDAYDASCDIRDTLLYWSMDSATASIQVDVLKVPHHGSDRTTSSGFYDFVRAYVYIVSGSHNGNTHGNPKFSSLKAIIKGFWMKNAPNNQPFRIFFSDPNIDQDYYTKKGILSSRSAVKGVLSIPELKPGPFCRYEMYRPATVSASYAAFGSILFGKDKNDNLYTSWDTNRWVKIAGP